MSWKIVKKLKEILSEESGPPIKRGGALSVCLVYPNRYATAMSNLGFQAVHGQLNDLSEVICDRAFLPDPPELEEYRRSGSRLMSLETQRPLDEFDVVAFSVSFENDYLNIPLLLDLAGIPLFSAERRESDPLVIAGGAALFLNPEPVADFLDLVCVGESEPLIGPLFELLLSGTEREELLSRLVTLHGVYVPSRYEARYDGIRLLSLSPHDGAPERVTRVAEAVGDGEATASRFLTPRTEFGDMALVEVSRGCPRGCRFCAAGFIYLPYRRRSREAVLRKVEEGLAAGKRIGLVGAAVSDYPEIGSLCREIVARQGEVSVSSLRIDALDAEMIDALRESGHKTVALAPEGGSQRLRDLIRKNVSEEQILDACDLLIEKDILNLKLYFIIGLPTEREEDLEELVALVSRIRERVIEAARRNRRLGEIVLSVNPFVPKPFTPFQWKGMEDMKSLEKKGDFLRRAVGRMSNVRMQMESPKEAWIQSLLSRGDRRLSRLLADAYRLGSLKRALKGFEPDPALYVHRDIPLDEALPWEVIAHDRDRLVREYRAAFGE